MPKLQDCENFVRSYMNNLPTPLLRACHRVLEDHRFFIWPASIDKHQAHVGGLLVHTAEVMQIALATGAACPSNPNSHYLIVGSLFHDYGKIWDYQLKDEKTVVEYLSGSQNILAAGAQSADTLFEKCSHRYNIRHPARSYHEFMTAAKLEGVDAATTEAIAHMILSHHGRLEWNATIEPQTVEAHILHYADMLSAFR